MNVPELCRTWECVRANWHPLTPREWALLAAFAIAATVVICWPEPHR